MENYYTILDMDEDSPYIPIPHLVNIEFGSDEDHSFALKLFKDKSESRLYMNEQTPDYFLKYATPYKNHSMKITWDVDTPSHPMAEAMSDKHPIEIDNLLPNHWVVTEGQLEYAHGFAAAIADCRKEKAMTKVNVIDHKNDQYTCPENFKEKDWFYNTVDQHHYYLMPLVGYIYDKVALINVERNQVVAIGEFAEAAINATFPENEANCLIRIPADQVEVTYKFYPDQD